MRVGTPKQNSSVIHKRISADLLESARLKEWAANHMAADILRAASLIVECIKGGGKVLFCGNGGSAADSQHLAAELIGRFAANRAPLPAVALTTDTSVLTAVANDMGYQQVFARQVEGLARPGDVLVAISTSGESENLCVAAKAAREKGMRSIGLLGKGGGRLAKLVDIPLVVASNSTPRVQECHVAIGHVICAVVEEMLFGNKGTDHG